MAERFRNDTEFLKQQSFFSWIGLFLIKVCLFFSFSNCARRLRRREFSRVWFSASNQTNSFRRERLNEGGNPTNNLIHQINQAALNSLIFFLQIKFIHLLSGKQSEFICLIERMIWIGLSGIDLIDLVNLLAHSASLTLSFSLIKPNSNDAEFEFIAVFSLSLKALN